MRYINLIMGFLGGFIIGSMMLLVVAEVLSRLFFDTSIEGSTEIVGMFLALAVFMGFAPCEANRSHVKVQLLVRLLSDRVVFTLNMIVYFLALLIVAIATWRVGLEALISFQYREVLPGANIQVPVYPAKIVAFFGFSAFFIQLVLNIILDVKKKSSASPSET
jgi:TRAP-type C4-dicarboxylate transport system permease small subunit